MKEVYAQHKKIDDKFLNLFEKKYIIFIEDGTDLKDQLPALPTMTGETRTASIVKNTARDGQSIKSSIEPISAGLKPTGRNLGDKSVISHHTNNDTTIRTFKLPKEQKAGKTVKIDINRYIVKYDFDVASKICPIKSGATYND